MFTALIKNMSSDLPIHTVFKNVNITNNLFKKLEPKYNSYLPLVV